MKAFWIGFIVGCAVGLFVATMKYGISIDAKDQLIRRAIRSKVAEYYLTPDGRLEFRFLTEHKEL